MRTCATLKKASLIVVGATLFYTLGLSPAAAAPNYSADVYDLGHKNKLYDFKVEGVDEGEITRYTSRYFDLEKKVLIEERTTLKGQQIVKTEIDQNQLGAKAVVEFDGKVAKFTKTVDGATKTESETVKGDFVMSANFQGYVQSHWKELNEGKTVNFRYGVWDRMETVGFQLRKTGETGEGAQKRIALQMKPSSFIIAALVNPLEFKFSADGAHLMFMKGRIQPKVKAGEKWKDQDGEVDYKW